MDIKEYVATRKETIKEYIKGLDIKPHLIIVSINEDPASQAYVRGKLKDGEEVGANVELVKLPLETTQKQLLDYIEIYNKDESIHGIIVQMPLPKEIDEEQIKNSIDVRKDVDGFNILSSFHPCTPYGIIKYLEFNKIDFCSKNVVVVGRSNIVGKPMAKLLLERHCNVTVLHSRTKKEDMNYYLSHADIVVSAVGKKYLLEGYKFKKDAVLIDVGINRVDGKLYGDIPPSQDVKLQTPVPGGVGLLTRLTLLENLLEAYKNEI